MKYYYSPLIAFELVGYINVEVEFKRAAV